MATDLGEAEHYLDEDAVSETAGSPILDEDENHRVTAQDPSQSQVESDIDQSASTADESISSLDQDLQVYVLGNKYGISDLKKKAARHFEKVLGNADLTIEIFNII